MGEKAKRRLGWIIFTIIAVALIIALLTHFNILKLPPPLGDTLKYDESAWGSTSGRYDFEDFDALSDGYERIKLTAVEPGDEDLICGPVYWVEEKHADGMHCERIVGREGVIFEFETPQSVGCYEDWCTNGINSITAAKDAVIWFSRAGKGGKIEAAGKFLDGSGKTTHTVKAFSGDDYKELHSDDRYATWEDFESIWAFDTKTMQTLEVAADSSIMAYSVQPAGGKVPYITCTDDTGFFGRSRQTLHLYDLNEKKVVFEMPLGAPAMRDGEECTAENPQYDGQYFMFQELGLTQASPFQYTTEKTRKIKTISLSGNFPTPESAVIAGGKIFAECGENHFIIADLEAGTFREHYYSEPGEIAGEIKRLGEDKFYAEITDETRASIKSIIVTSFD